MKLCKDCKWCRLSLASKIFGYWDIAKCVSPLALREVSPVNGKEILYVEFCATQRAEQSEELKSYCGLSGRWFEPKDAK